jgi:general secretion pathway protein A
MEYYKLLQLEREPFSNSPDPDYFFQSRQHTDCLHRLELALRLKRGLNVVIGEVGTGKTTLCRELIRRFADQSDVETHLILDPSFSSPAELSVLLYQMLAGPRPADDLPAAEIKEKIKQALFSKGIDQNRTVVLIVDEGQKISPQCIELLRELLNYETNSYKLLQIVIFAQPEFESILQSQANFTDRINLLHHLRPMDFRDTRQMIMYRLRLASRDARPLPLFTWPALWSIYRASRGYPRRIVNLCHQSVLTMIIQNRTRAGWRLIRSCRKRLQPIGRRKGVFLWAAAALIAVIGAIAAYEQWNRIVVDAALERFKVPSPAASAPLPSPPAPEGATYALPGLPPPPDIVPPVAEVEAQNASNPALSPAAGLLPLTEALSAEEPASDALPQAPEPILPKGPADVSPDPLPPRLLGTLSVLPGDTLVSMVRSVYGAYRHRLLRTVIDANPGIQDPNTIEIGDTLVFPAVRFAPETGSETAWAWIILQQPRSLAHARASQSELESRWNLPSRIIAYWTSSGGLHFQLALNETFTDRNQAQTQMARLPAEAAAQARILDSLPAAAQLYSILPIAMSSPHAQ